MKYPARIFPFLIILTLVGCGEESSVVRDGPARQPGLSATQKESARGAVKTLQDFGALANKGSNPTEYSKLVFPLKERIDKTVITLPKEELRKEIELAIRAYVDYGVAWEAMELRKFQDWYRLSSEYPIPKDTSQPLDRDQVLKAVWDEGRKHADRAATLLGS